MRTEPNGKSRGVGASVLECSVDIWGNNIYSLKL